MNRKIPFHELAAMLAGNCNITQAEAEDFIKNFFEQLSRSLTEGETVKIKGIGTFAPGSDADNPVAFTPDTEIAESINAPFAMFEPEEVSDTLSDEAFEEVDQDSEQAADAPDSETESIPEPTVIAEETASEQTQEEASAPLPENEPAPSVEAVVEVIAEETVAEQPQESNTTTDSPETTPTPEPVAAVETVTESSTAPIVETATTIEKPVETEQPKADINTPSQVQKSEPQPLPATTDRPKATPSFPEEEPEEYLRYPERKSCAGFGWGFVIGLLVGLAVGACGVYFAIDYIFPTMPDSYGNVKAEDDLIAEAILIDSVAAPLGALPDTTATAAPADTVKQAPATATPEPAPAAQPVKDTVRPGYLLNDMAKKHYGNKCFWVYIYEENKAKIANPNRVGPGLVLVIPPAEKYGIDSSSAASIKAANEKAGKILTKYPK